MNTKLRYLNVSPMELLDASKLCYVYDQVSGGENTTVTDPGSLDEWFDKMNVSKSKQKDLESEFEKLKKKSLLNGVIPDIPTDFNEGSSAKILAIPAIVILSIIVNF
eukprot:NODE_215_length_14308_cov_0.330987.p9 type:complete len:107 gc:universal NODE_215_length_14308_cov_0.330987:10897-10577(-)